MGPPLCSALVLAMAGVAAADGNTVVVNDRVRVTALSETVLRIEPKGPKGFEDRTTFMVVNRTAFVGIPLTLKSSSPTSAVLTTTAYTVTLSMAALPPTPAGPRPMCTPTANTDAGPGASRISSCSEHQASCLAPGATQSDCCNNCSATKECTAWIYDPNHQACWLMSRITNTVSRPDRVTGGNTAGGDPVSGISVAVTSASGQPLWNTTDLTSVGQNLDWPSPTTASAYAIKDYPRFFAPEWGPTPIPADQQPNVDPALLPTNGFDYGNNGDGDTYVFLLGDSLDSWFDSRRDFVTLAGPTPAIPDWAFGTWFTFWHQYSEAEAKGEIERWNNDKLPLDVWALDMNWRNSPHGHQPNCTPNNTFFPQHYYDYPNTDLFPDFADPGTGWFDWIKGQKLRTYFNDHPFPTDNGTALQTTPDEVKFRHEGLTKWLSQGLTYWWFDANWAFSIPPPNVEYGGHGDGAAWDGMDNRVWGSYLYWTTNRVFNEDNPNREHTMPPQAPLALTKYADGNMHPGLVQHQHPAQHRYPVWWTGDGVDLEASVESMVDSGVYDFKPYVHSDCGGDYRPSIGGDLLRWTAHCAFGSIHRFHGSAHQPWSYDNHTEDVIREYLNMRYTHIPSLVSAGHSALDASFPIVARCDLYWPEHAADGANSNHQYIYLNDTLVAPIWDSKENVTQRYVWIPPGSWTDAWSGQTITGPQNLSVSQPYERQPMWHNSNGGLSVITSSPMLRVDDQDWSELTLEAFPAVGTDRTTERVLHGQAHSGARTFISMETSSSSQSVHFSISAAQDGAARSWVVRIHLKPGDAVRTAWVDGVAVEVFSIAPTSVEEAHRYFPFHGKGSAPAPQAGHVAEIHVPVAATARSITVQL